MTSIGIYAFYECSGLKEVRSYIEKPFAIDGVFMDNMTATLYVPAGTKALYQATGGWKNFENIIEMEPQQELEPVDNGEDIDFGDENSEIDENTDLDGNVIGNIYYNIAPGNGGYNPVEGCIEVTKPMSDEDMEELEGKDIFGEDVSKQFAGIVFKVPAGSGTITVNAETIGGMTLKVKIGNQEPIEMILVGKMKMKIPYSVTKPTYVYIYAGEMDASRRQGYAASVQPCLKLYGLELNAVKTKGDLNGDSEVNGTDIVSLVNVIMKGTNNSAADVNGDGEVNGTDIVALVNIIMKGAPSREMAVAGSGVAENNSQTTVGAELTQADTGNGQELTISLENPDMDVTMVQMDVTLPEGVSITNDEPLMGGRTSERSHSLYVSQLSEHTVCLLLASGRNALIEGNEGSIIRLPLTVSDGFEDGDILIGHILCTSPDLEEARPADVSVRVGETTGISDATRLNDNGQRGIGKPVYNLNGQRLDTLRKGLNIVNGRKVIK